MKRFLRYMTLRLTAGLCIFTAISFSGLALHAERESTSKPTAKIRVSAVRVEMIQSHEIKLPAEFQVALYENLIQQLGKKGGYASWYVYRDGDRNAANLTDLVVLRSTVLGFKQGSEEKRQVTTVAGATSITVHCQFIDNQGKVLLERDIDGKVRFFGANLKATYDFAKKVAKAAHENFSATEGM